LNTQTVLVVLKLDDLASLDHLLELAPLLPFVLPDAVIGRITDIVIGNRRTIYRRQLILPVGVGVGELHCILYRRGIIDLYIGLRMPPISWNWMHPPASTSCS